MSVQLSFVDIEFIEAVAQRVAEILAERAREDRLVSVSELAARLGVNRSWVYENADWLGAIRLGTGPKAALRFDLRIVMSALESCSDDVAPLPRASQPRRRSALIPIRGGESSPPRHSTGT